MASHDDRRERSYRQPIESIVEDNREIQKPIDREKVLLSYVMFNLCDFIRINWVKFIHLCER